MIPQIRPFLDKKELSADLSEYVASEGWFTEHEKTHELENIIATFLGKRHCIIVPSGTTALSLSLLALVRARSPEINRDQVIVPDLTMIATANSVLAHDMPLMPALADIEKQTGCLDCSGIINGYTRARGLIYVSLNGRSGDMEKIQDFCSKYNLFFIEDACQSFGSKTSNGKYLGTIGDIGCFSFSPHKIITTGQGGAIVTDMDDLASEIRHLKDFGRKKKGIDEHITLGFNFKFTDLQAVVGLNQMKSIQWRIEQKKTIYDTYYNKLNKVTGIFMLERDSNTVPWFVDVYSEKRDKIKEALNKANIGCRPIYPPLHTQFPYNLYGGSHKKFCVSNEFSRTGLWLPSYLGITENEIQQVCSIVTTAAF